MSELEKNRNPLLPLVTVMVGSLAVGFAASHYLFPSSPAQALSTDDCNSKYLLLRTDLDCTTMNDDYMRVTKIQDSLNNYIYTQKAAGKVTRVSVFFRDLSSRRWAAVAKEEKYAPGSLLKVPLAIAYYKLAEVEPNILAQEYVYKPTEASMNDMETFKPKDKLVVGAKYNVETLIEHMIKDSDNDATSLLGSSIDQTFLNKVFSDLGVHIPESGGSEQNFLTVDNYSSILRSLYLASYLSVDNSQKLLALMAQTSFSDGIAGGVPDEIPVAHKFGEREVIDATTDKETSAELHDCGIVYKKDHPYILCVMTEGKSYDDLTKVLAESSKLVYDSE